jgi:hypothetical protein
MVFEIILSLIRGFFTTKPRNSLRGLIFLLTAFPFVTGTLQWFGILCAQNSLCALKIAALFATSPAWSGV